jgi:hypothetical protein
MILTPVQYVDIPVVNDIDMTVPRNSNPQPRRAIYKHYTLNNISSITMDVTPFNPYWVEVWHNEWRVINTDPANPKYIIVDNQVTFTSINSGQVLIVIDTEPIPYYAASIVHVSSVQRQTTTNTFTSTVGQVNYTLTMTPPNVNSITVTVNDIPKTFAQYSLSGTTLTLTTAPEIGSTVKVVINHYPISLRSEPVALTQPWNGYVRLTADRRNLVYVPNTNFVGYDTFNWSLITQNGQIGPAKCAKIFVE